MPYIKANWKTIGLNLYGTEISIDNGENTETCVLRVPCVYEHAINEKYGVSSQWGKG